MGSVPLGACMTPPSPLLVCLLGRATPLVLSRQRVAGVVVRLGPVADATGRVQVVQLVVVSPTAGRRMLWALPRLHQASWHRRRASCYPTSLGNEQPVLVQLCCVCMRVWEEGVCAVTRGDRIHNAGPKGAALCTAHAGHCRL
jgi:hypothetical protein